MAGAERGRLVRSGLAARHVTRLGLSSIRPRRLSQNVRSVEIRLTSAASGTPVFRSVRTCRTACVRSCTERDCGLDRMPLGADEVYASPMKRVVVDRFSGPEVLKVVERGRSSAGSGRSPRQGSGRRRIVHRRAHTCRHLPGRAEAAVHAGATSLSALSRRCGPGLHEAARRRPRQRSVDDGAPTRSACARPGGTRSRCPRTSTRRRSLA